MPLSPTIDSCRAKQSQDTFLQDSFGRTHHYLRISLTEKCNLRCTYCMPEEGVQLTPNNQLLLANEIETLASQFVDMGVTRIRLTGGEPLLRKDFEDIATRLSKLPVELTLTTNAVLADRYLDVFLATGIKTINVSLDTLDAEKFTAITKRNHWQKTMDNIRLLVKHGIVVKVNAVIRKGMNETELLDFVEWTRKEPVHVRFIEFMPFEGNQWKWDNILSIKSMLEQIKASYPIEKLDDGPNAIAKNYRVSGFAGTFGIISSMTENFCGSCNRIRLTANGKLRNCLFSNNEVDLLTPLREGKNVAPIVQEHLLQKKAKHGGIKDLPELSSSGLQLSSRSMILIGG